MKSISKILSFQRGKKTIVQNLKSETKEPKIKVQKKIICGGKKSTLKLWLLLLLHHLLHISSSAYSNTLALFLLPSS